MKTRHWMVFATWTTLGLAAALAATGEEEVRVRDLTGRETLDAAELVEILTPREPPPPGAPLTRGRSLGPAPVPDCEFYRESISRGLGVKPAADIVAMEIQFDFDSAVIRETEASKLEALAQALHSPKLSPCCFRLEGHADAVGAETYNLTLSERRARAVAEYLVEKLGVAQGRLMTKGFGEANPIASNDSEDGRRRNRRVEIVNLGYGQVGGEG